MSGAVRRRFQLSPTGPRVGRTIERHLPYSAKITRLEED